MKQIFLLITLISIHTITKSQSLSWVKQIGSDRIDMALGVAVDGSGNSYTVGHYQRRVNFNTQADSFISEATSYGEAFITKTSPSGGFMAALTFGQSASYHKVAASSIGFDATGNMYVSGFFDGSNIDFNPDTAVAVRMSAEGSGNNAFVMKMDAAGNFIWVKGWAYGKDDGIEEEKGPAMKVDADGNIFLAGRFKGNTDFDPGTDNFILPGKGEDGYVMKLDSAGNFVWAKQFATDTAIITYIHPRAISIDGGGNLYIAGSFKGTIDFDTDTAAKYEITSDALNGFVAKLDGEGNFEWAKNIGTDETPLLEYHRGNAVVADAAGNTYITGSFMGTVSFGSISLTSAGISDIYVAKLDGEGNYLWAKPFGSIYDGEEGALIVLDNAGQLYVTGTYRGSVDFNAGAGVHNLTTNGIVDVFILKMNSDGEFIWAAGYGGASSTERINGIAISGNDVYTVGKFMKTVNFDPNGVDNRSATLVDYDYYDAFIHKMNQSTTSIAATEAEMQIAVVPNPSTDKVTVYIDTSTTTASTISLLDIQGHLIQTTPVHANAVTFSVNGLAKGIYFLKLHHKNGYATKKLLVQ